MSMKITWNELHRDFASGAEGSHTLLLAAVLHHAADEIATELRELKHVLREKGEQLMAKSQELQDALDAITGAITDATAELKKLADELQAIAANPTIDPAQVSAAATSMQTLATNLRAATGAADAEANPTPKPTP